jgi:hypothetical protein
MRIIRSSALVLVGLALGACAVNPQGNNSGAVSPPPGEGTKTFQLPEATPAAPEITLAEYDAIQKGWTYDQVKEKVGVAGEVTSSYDASDPKWSSKSYKFNGSDLGSTAVISFTGGVVDNKMQFGLK